MLIDLPYQAYAERLARTTEVLQSHCDVVYEASFCASGVFTAVDILKRDNSGFRLVEVKSSTSVKDHHIPDVAVQTYVLRQNGLDVTGADVMHLNPDCSYPDLSNLFTRTDVTEATIGFEAKVPSLVAEQFDMLEKPVPNISKGPHCTTPYECPFMRRCWSPLPADHVSTLYAMKRRAFELDEQGYATIHDLPEDVQLGRIADRQRRAVRERRMIVEPTLASALNTFIAPIAFIDFETVGLAVPIWAGCHPYDPVPVQFSCHAQGAGGVAVAFSWLAESSEDPRPALAERLIKACEGARTIVAYNAAFEKRCLELMANALPFLAEPLRDIADRLQDLLPVVRNHVYHPDFQGSFSLKSVLPVLVPELRYEGLTIADGATASWELERLLLDTDSLTAGAKSELRTNLLRYCHQDTFGLVKILERLRQLAQAGVLSQP
jgi:predicted RecB family nuclease